MPCVTQRDVFHSGLLIPEECGLLWALFHAGLDERVLGQLEKNSRDRCQAGYRALAELPAEEREAELATWQSEACAACPPGLDRLHPSWIKEAIRHEPLVLIRPFLQGLPTSVQCHVDAYFAQEAEESGTSSELPGLDPRRGREILRFLLNPLEAFLSDAIGPLASELRALAFDQLILRIMHHGAETVGRSLSGAPLAIRAKAMAALGKPWAALVGEHSSEKLSADERTAALNHTMAAIPSSATSAEDRLFHIGLSVLKEPLFKEGVESLFSVAGRLPHSLGCPWLGALWRGW